VNDAEQPYTSPYVLCKNCHQDVGVAFEEEDGESLPVGGHLERLSAQVAGLQ